MFAGLGTFYFSVAEPRDWTDPQSNDLWRDGSKNLFDPCPAGWRVPESGDGEFSPWGAFTVDNGPWNGEGKVAGRRWNADAVYGGPAWYAASGFRDAGNNDNFGRLNFVSERGYSWSSSVYRTFSSFLDFNTTIVLCVNSSRRAHGFPVRCIRE